MPHFVNRTDAQPIIRLSLAFPILLTALLACPSILFAQTTEGDSLIIQHTTGPTTGSPRANAKGGALAERAPGNWGKESIRRHIAYQKNSLSPDGAGGGDPPQDGDERPEPRHRIFLLALLEGVFDLVAQLGDLLELMKPPQPVPV